MKEWAWICAMIYVVIVTVLLIANKRFWDTIKRIEKHEREQIGEN